MFKKLFLILATCSFTLVHAQKCAHPINIVVLGSSTSAGAGTSKPDSAYVNRFKKFLVDSVNSGCKVTNLAIGGATTYKMQPSWYSPPSNRSSFPADTARNIDKAISLKPDGIIINYPSNDAASNFMLQEQKDNFLRVKAKADSAGIPVWITTTQPRNFTNASQKQLLTDMRDWSKTTFGNNVIDFWTLVAEANGDIKSLYNSGDGVHLNDAGHFLLFGQVKAEGIHQILCDTPTNIYLPGNNMAGKLFLYPNPANDILNIQLSDLTTGIVICNIYDLFGKVVLKSELHIENSNDNIPLNIQAISTGTYIFQLTVGPNVFREILIKN